MQDLPLGFEFALAQNPEAMKFFANLTETEQNQLIEQSKTMQYRTEMRNFVQHLSQQQGGF